VDSLVQKGHAKLQGPRAEQFILSGWEKKSEKKKKHRQEIGDLWANSSKTKNLLKLVKNSSYSF